MGRKVARVAFRQLQCPLPVYVLDKGKGLTFAVIDYGPEHNLIWVSAIDETGEIWCVPNSRICMQENWTMGRARSQAEDSTRAAASAANSG